MSSNPEPVIRKSLCHAGIVAGLVFASPVAAQDDAGMTAQPESNAAEEDEADEQPERERIDILITVPRGDVNPAQARECEDNADAARLTGEIIVCRQLGEDPSNRFSSPSDAQRRYAEETAFANDPGTPDVAGGGIFRGPATVSGVCLIPPCPPEAAIIIDIESLPEAPPGSDADRIARGLPPLGQDEPSEEEIRRRREALGLPPPTNQSSRRVSSSGSAAPEETP